MDRNSNEPKLLQTVVFRDLQGHVLRDSQDNLDGGFNI